MTAMLRDVQSPAQCQDDVAKRQIAGCGLNISRTERFITGLEYVPQCHRIQKLQKRMSLHHDDIEKSDCFCPFRKVRPGASLDRLELRGCTCTVKELYDVRVHCVSLSVLEGLEHGIDHCRTRVWPMKESFAFRLQEPSLTYQHTLESFSCCRSI